MKVEILHTDGVTKVKAKVFITSDSISLDYRFEGMDYGRTLTKEQAKVMGIIK